jgi:hypothetical protein
LRGKHVHVTQLLSWRPGTGFERHSTVRSEFSLYVAQTMWQMSGGHYVIYGQREFQYSIGTSKLHTIEIETNQLIATELFGTEAERRSTVTILPA